MHVRGYSQRTYWSLSARRAWIEIRLPRVQVSPDTSSLSARRAWIEIPAGCWRDARRAVALRKESVDRNRNSIKRCLMSVVALRKESVDRNYMGVTVLGIQHVALRKESVDRNPPMCTIRRMPLVALRKESVDRNCTIVMVGLLMYKSLSARRAWIEIPAGCWRDARRASLSARRAWIEMVKLFHQNYECFVALRKESVDRNLSTAGGFGAGSWRRSPQGERG